MKLNKNHLHIFDDRPLDALEDHYADTFDVFPEDFADVHEAMLKRFHATKTLTIESKLEGWLVWCTIACSTACCSLLDSYDDKDRLRPSPENQKEYTALLKAGNQLARWYSERYPDDIVEFPDV